MFTRTSLAALAAALLFTSPSVNGHSWVDDLTIVGGSTTPTGTKGYIRNYQGHLDEPETYRITDPQKASLICMPTQQQALATGPNFPMLKASAGDYVMATYTENGHISKPNAADAVVGDIMWYGTTDTSLGASQSLAQVLTWTAEGDLSTGRLLGTTPFDDTVCIENNDSQIAQARIAAGLGGACKSTFQIPEDVDADTLTVFWVWDYSGNLGSQDPGHVEYYTSCMDIQMTNRPSTSPGSSGNGTNTTGAKRDLVHSAKFRLPRVEE